MPNTSFRRFWLGQVASNFGDAFAFVAVPLLVFDTTHSLVHMGYVTAVAGAGQFAAAIFSGVIVDRSHRRHLMVACDLARFVLYAALPLASLLGGRRCCALRAAGRARHRCRHLRRFRGESRQFAFSQ